MNLPKQISKFISHARTENRIIRSAGLALATNIHPRHVKWISRKFSTVIPTSTYHENLIDAPDPECAFLGGKQKVWNWESLAKHMSRTTSCGQLI